MFCNIRSSRDSSLNPGRRTIRCGFQPSFRGLLLPLAMGLILSFYGDSAAAPIPKGDITIELELVVSGLAAPLGVTHAGDSSGRLFIHDQAGQIWIMDSGSLLTTPFLDLSSKLPALNPFFDERGLLGLAFHPNYETNGRFFVRYSAPRSGDSSEPCFGTSRGCHKEVLAEYSVSSGNPNLADPLSEIILFEIDEPQFNHNAGDVAFGPDGFLYFSLGDGGGANDGLADAPPSHGPIGHGQNVETALGSILRIDVDGSPPYTIPSDNPFVGITGLDEIYAYGMRNPYRFSFDDGPGGDGRLFLADVGQNLFEEVNIVVNGGNYGWVIREGLHCFDPFNPTTPPGTCSDTGPLGEPLIDPIVEYSHPGSGFTPEGGITVIGGFAYRGSRSPGLTGKYVFGDFARSFFTPSGSLYYLVEPTTGTFAIRQFRIGASDTPYGLFLKGFGEDEDGEIYACGSTELAAVGTGGVVHRLVQVTEVSLDIFPEGCPNSLSMNRRGGVIPAAILGSESFDVLDVDVSTLALEGVGARRTRTDDVGAPGAADPCDCAVEGPDGITDLSLFFRAVDILTALEPMTVGEVRPLTLTGELLDGTPFVAVDCIRIVGGPPGIEEGPTDPIEGIPESEAKDTGFGIFAGGDASARVKHITYQLPEQSEVRISVYDVAGRRVRMLVYSVQPAGSHTVEWSTAGLPSGLYFYRMEAGALLATQKVVVIH